MQSTFSNFSIFFLVIDLGVVETATSFLIFQNTYWHSGFSVYRYNI